MARTLLLPSVCFSPGPASATTFTAANSVHLLGIGLLFTQSVTSSASFLALNALGDLGSYVVSDRIWAFINGSAVPAQRTL